MTRKHPRSWSFFACALAFSVCSCGRRHEGLRREGFALWKSSDDKIMLLGTAVGEVVAFDPQTGGELWRYQAPSGKAGLFEAPPPAVVCPPRTTYAGTTLISHSDWLNALSTKDGHPIWRRFRGRELVCPETTPDSGVVLTDRRSSVIVKLDHEGKEQWTAPLPSYARRIRVVSDSGDIVVRTSDRLLSLSPAGVVNWEVDLERLRARDPPAARSLDMEEVANRAPGTICELE